MRPERQNDEDTMGEPAMAAPSTTRRRAAPAQPWSQQPGENTLWYARFLRYVALGPKRSVSLVAMGRRNAYPVPAHWPIQSKQNSWLERAKAFDEAYRKDPIAANSELSTLIVSTRAAFPPEKRDEAMKLEGVAYLPPGPEDEYGDSPDTDA